MNGNPTARRVLVGLVGFVLVVLSSVVVLCEPQTYAGITFPNGDLSFADRVASYVQGSCVRCAFSDPRAALGPPDCNGDGCNACYSCDPCSVALGFRISAIDDRGFVVLEFVDNRLVDVPGDDLFVYATGTHPFIVEISADGGVFTYVGDGYGYPAAFDIAPYVSRGQEFRFVRLSDVPGDEDRGPCSGPSIDAVGAMGFIREVGFEQGSLELLPEGQLALAVARVPRNILIILDSSTSMAETFENSTKMLVAKEVLQELVDDIPTDALTGLRVFGGCDNSQLLVPIGPLNRARLKSEIQAATIAGATPLAYTLNQARGDFADFPDAKLIILVSDGQETCDGELAPIRAAEALVNVGYDLRIHAVGFDVSDNQDARRQLMEIAAATNGSYFDADSSEQLRAALRLSVEIRYRVIDQQGQQVFEGVLGEPGPTLTAGSYRVIIETSPPVELLDVLVLSEQTTRIKVAQTNGGVTAEVEP